MWLNFMPTTQGMSLWPAAAFRPPHPNCWIRKCIFTIYLIFAVLGRTQGLTYARQVLYHFGFFCLFVCLVGFSFLDEVSCVQARPELLDFISPPDLASKRSWDCRHSPLCLAQNLYWDPTWFLFVLKFAKHHWDPSLSDVVTLWYNKKYSFGLCPWFVAHSS
jgi:hypothetical protein